MYSYFSINSPPLSKKEGRKYFYVLPKHQTPTPTLVFGYLIFQFSLLLISVFQDRRGAICQKCFYQSSNHFWDYAPFLFLTVLGIYVLQTINSSPLNSLQNNYCISYRRCYHTVKSNLQPYDIVIPNVQPPPRVRIHISKPKIWINGGCAD